LALLPEGAQIVVEIDLARLRSNQVIGAVVKRVLDEAAQSGSALPAGVPASPLAGTDRLGVAAGAVGPPQAAAGGPLRPPGRVARSRVRGGSPRMSSRSGPPTGSIRSRRAPRSPG